MVLPRSLREFPRATGGLRVGRGAAPRPSVRAQGGGTVPRPPSLAAHCLPSLAFLIPRAQPVTGRLGVMALSPLMPDNSWSQVPWRTGLLWWLFASYPAPGKQSIVWKGKPLAYHYCCCYVTVKVKRLIFQLVLTARAF